MENKHVHSKQVNLAKRRNVFLTSLQLMLLMLIFPAMSQAAVNVITSASIDPIQSVPLTYGTGAVTEYSVQIFTNNGSEAGTSIISLGGTALPEGVVVSCRNGTLTVIGNEIQLPAFMPSGTVFVRIATAGIGACFNITPPGTTNGVKAILTSSPTNIETGTCSFVIGKKALNMAGIGAEPKEYDGTTAVTFTAGGALSGVNCSDVVGFTTGGVFSSANVAFNVPVIAAFTINGPDADKYTLNQPNLVANINRKVIPATIHSFTKCQGDPAVYDGDEFTANGFLNGDHITSFTITCFGNDEFAAAGIYQAFGSDPVGVGLDNYAIQVTHGTLNNIAIPEIVSSFGGTRCGPGSVAINATPNSGVTKWYSAAVGGDYLGSGTNFNTPVINATTTFYAEANNGSCPTVQARTPVVATIENCTQLRAFYCGRTLVNLNDYMSCDLVPGANFYAFELTDPANNSYYFTSATGGIRLNLIPEILYGTSYSIRVKTQTNGVWSSWGSSCIVRTPPTKLKDWYCGITQNDATQYLECYPVFGALQYKFELTEGGTTYTHITNGIGFRMSFYSGLKYNTVYSVRVSAKVGGVWSDYGAPCAITTPLTKMQTWYCGITLSAMNQYLACSPVANATNYRFRLQNGGNTLTYISNNIGFRMSLVPGIQTGTIYSVSVASQVGGVWSDYGTACNITSAAVMNAMQNDQDEIDELDGQLIEDISIEVFPNPAIGSFELRTSSEGDFLLTNELGQILKTIHISKEHGLKTTIEGLETGLYFISSESQTQHVTTQKVFVIK